MAAEEGKLQPRPSEATPLLRKESPQGADYHSLNSHNVETGSSSTEYDEEPALLGLTRVSSTPQDLEIEPILERLPSVAGSVSKAHGGAGSACSTADEDENYASRFINVSPARFWFIFAGVMLGYTIGFFDSTLMASSHPVITSYFHAANTASWLSTAFLLTSTAFLPLFGRISDAFGRKPVYLFSICMFFLTTAWCGLAQSIGSFIAARALCGLGAGGVFSMGQIVSSDLVRLEYRGIYQSYLNLCLGIGGCLGLACGGLLCDQVGWRGAFLVQLPFILLYLVGAAWTIPADLGVKRTGPVTIAQLIRSIDLTGSFILVVAVTGLIMGLNLGGNVFPWAHPLVIGSLVTSCILAVVFVRYERHIPRAVMPVELLSHNPRASLIFGNFFGAISVNTMVFNAPLYFQAVKLASPTDSGLRLVAASVAVTTSSVATGFLITWSKRLKPTIIIGGALMLFGGLAAAYMDVGTPEVVAMVCVSFSSLGQGFSFPSMLVSVLATSDQEEQAVATTTLGLWRNLGSVMGVSISSWIFQNTLFYHLERKVTGAEKDHVIGLVRKSISVIAELDPVHRHQVIGAYATALRMTFLSAALWGGIMLSMHLRLRLPRLGRKA
ncbi:major facilitator superfamily-domain-containing protein [Penicillium alfredii]|uniref:Major facilitator superfamily-domain-containing protein n=1 Tax=Penicillium alfredii TaxID=1506179 RepID=A0A9W9F1T0_9EURO|nr:major facilitator superfamily-domain-containing protein [Penicillium alfredii]KAJ5091901.1 major facilitator superfamily-domain-containing protein [Penicillium alfredii]